MELDACTNSPGWPALFRVRTAISWCALSALGLGGRGGEGVREFREASEEDSQAWEKDVASSSDHHA